jgi:hypothetical protein
MRARAAGVLLSAQIFAVAAAVPVLVRLKLARLAGRLEPAPRRRPADPVEVDELIQRIERVLERGYPLVRTGCLTRGITLFYFLRRAGVDVRLAFGMGRPFGDDEGHCWLVKDGLPYLEKVDPRGTFAEIYSIPPARA